jgi:hypothetical protein
MTVASGSVVGGATVTRRNKLCVARTGLSTVGTNDVADAQRDLVAVVAKLVAWIRKNRWQVQAERSNFFQATVAAGFQRAFPACEAIREPLRQLQGAGAMPAPYCFHGRASGWRWRVRQLGGDEVVAGMQHPAPVSFCCILTVWKASLPSNAIPLHE